MLLELACIILVGYFVCIGTDILLYRYNKSVHGGSNTKLIWYYRLRRYVIDVPPIYLSTYHLQVHESESENLKYFATLDDPVIKQITEDFDDICKGKSLNFRIHCLQAMIQQNVKYISDSRRFGLENCWCFPIRTLTTKCGDCEDSALLYAGIAANLGIDVALIYFPTHMLVGVKFCDTCAYIPLELTGYMPVNAPIKTAVGGKVVIPEYPTEEFKSRIQRY
jgi:hypothetical protein